MSSAVRRRPDWAGYKAGKARRSAAYWKYVSIRGPKPNAVDGPRSGGAQNRATGSLPKGSLSHTIAEAAGGPKG